MIDNDMNNKPLPYRMAPRNLDEYIGQEHILGKGKMLRRMIEADQLSSIILFNNVVLSSGSFNVGLITFSYCLIIPNNLLAWSWADASSFVKLEPIFLA